MLFYDLISLQDAYPLLGMSKGPPILFPTCSTHYQPNVLEPSVTCPGLWFGSILCIQHLLTPSIIALQITLILKHPCHILCIASISLCYTCLSRSSWIATTTYTNPYRGVVFCLARPEAVSRPKPARTRPGQAKPNIWLREGFAPPSSPARPPPDPQAPPL